MTTVSSDSKVTSPGDNHDGSGGHGGGGGGGQFGDTTLTKVFVGGLAWETPKEVLRQHFEKYGDLLEAVIISDKITGRSKGYGFVTFKEAEAANRACEDAAPIINGRRANCNLAALGARRPRQLSNSSTPAVGLLAGKPNSIAAVGAGAGAGYVQWYYPPGASPAAAPFHPQHQLPVPYYGYSPAYIATAGVSNNNHHVQKLSYNGGSYSYGHGHYAPHHPMYVGGQGVVGAATTAAATAMMPIYPFYPFHHQQHPHHQSAAAMGVPAAHMFHPSTTVCPISAASPPAVISNKPLITSLTMAPAPVRGAAAAGWNKDPERK